MTQRDVALAAEIGAAWAVFVRGQFDIRRPWPPFSGCAAAIALWLVEGRASARDCPGSARRPGDRCVAIDAIAPLPIDRARLYFDVIMMALPAVRRALEAHMQNHEYRSDFARTYRGQSISESLEKGAWGA